METPKTKYLSLKPLSRRTAETETDRKKEIGITIGERSILAQGSQMTKRVLGKEMRVIAFKERLSSITLSKTSGNWTKKSTRILHRSIHYISHLCMTQIKRRSLL